ncbi:MAG: FeoA domain-containing protein [Deltaproteobacteria bacterium]|nr:FeoA domain-containing protein [Deltaproteobacteria bacterium]
MSDLAPGQKASIMAIKGGRGVRQSLLLRGLNEGNIFRVVKSHPGPIVIEINGSTMAIGRGMANKIIVRSLGV